MQHLALALGVLLMASSTKTPYEEDANPLTLGPSTITDRRGNLVYTDEDDPEEAMPTQTEYIGTGVGVAQQNVYTSGVNNSDFLLPPPDTTLSISDMNSLPYWRLVEGGDASIVYKHVTAAASPSGKAIRATIANGVVDDEAMFEQIIPVSPRERLKLPILRSTVGADADTGAEIRIQYFTAAGVSTGSESSGALDPAFLNPQDVYALAGIPTDARYARIRFGVVLTGTVTSDTIDFYEAWAGTPHISYETWTFSDVTLAGTGTNTITAVAGNSAGSVSVNTEQYLSPDAGQGTIGWVEAISVRLHDARSTGTAAFQLEGFSTGLIGPVATIDATDTKNAWATATLLDSSALLTPGDLHTVRNTGDSFTPTTADSFIVVRVAFVQLATTTGGGTG